MPLKIFITCLSLASAEAWQQMNVVAAMRVSRGADGRAGLTLSGRFASWLGVYGTPNAEGVRKAGHDTKPIGLIGLWIARLLLWPFVSYAARV